MVCKKRKEGRKLLHHVPKRSLSRRKSPGTDANGWIVREFDKVSLFNWKFMF